MKITKLPARTSEKVIKGVLGLIKLPIPPTLIGSGTLTRFPEIIALSGVRKVLVVTDKTSRSRGLLTPFLTALKAAEIDHEIFGEIEGTPYFENIYDGLDAYHHGHCDGVVAFGPDAVIDAGKIIAAKVTNDKPLPKLAGLFKLTHRIPPFFVVPTQPGAGSEAGVDALLLEPSLRKKILIHDPKLAPLATVIDPELSLSLNPAQTANGGFEILAQACESYLSRAATKFTSEKAVTALSAVLENLVPASLDGNNLNVRRCLAQASFDAGLAATRTGGGYCQAIARVVSAYYDVSESEVCAAALPVVLAHIAPSAEKKLAELGQVAGLGDPWEDRRVVAERFIHHIAELQGGLPIAATLDVLMPADIPELSRRVQEELGGINPFTQRQVAEDANTILMQICTICK